MDPVGVALVGAGPWGLTLGARVRPASRRPSCAGSATSTPSGGAWPRAAHPGRHVDALDEVLADPGVAAVVVAVDSPAPPRRRAARARGRPARAGRKAAWRCRVADAARAGRRAAERAPAGADGRAPVAAPPGGPARPAARSRQGRWDEPLYFEATRVGARDRRARPGSAWWALAPHDVSLALYLFGAAPDRGERDRAVPRGRGADASLGDAARSPTGASRTSTSRASPPRSGAA